VRYLLDTHVFIWWAIEDPRLSADMLEAIGDPTNRLYLSAASTWEMMIKSRLKKLRIPSATEAFIAGGLSRNRVDRLPITIEHTLALGSLESFHKDPFDRMPIAQARHDDLTLMTDDPLIRQYRVKTLP
jgi:PIN domain nuclease of toxin-antitoxin system